MMRAAKWALLTLAVVAIAGPVQAQTADEVVQKHLAAIGGRDALAKLTSQVATGTVSVSVQGNDISGPLEVYHKAPNKSRTYFKLDLSVFGAGEMTVDQRCDGKAGFESNSMQGDREITGKRLQGMLNNTFPSPFLDYKAAGATVELKGKEKIDGKDAFVIVYTPKTGTPSTQYFDAESFLLVKTVSKTETPETGEIESSTALSDYRAVDGLKVPFTMNVTNPMQTVTIKLAKVEHNTPIDDAMFAKPAAPAK